MKRSIVTAVVATAAVFALSACGAGMNSQTADMVAPVAGVYADMPGKDGNGKLSVRNAALVYPGPEGYKAGSDATARLWLFNESPAEQLVVISYEGQEIERVTIKPGSFARSEVKFTVAQAVNNAADVLVIVDFVGAGNPLKLKLPVAPPESHVPGVKIELPAETGGEGH